jgi:phage gp45-like
MRNLIRIGTIKSILTRLGLISGTATSLDAQNPENITMLHTYGFNSAPPAGMNCMMYAPFGYTENVFAIPFNPKAPVIQIGETIIYNAVGSQVYLQKDGSILITAPETTVSGSLSVTGNINTESVYKVNNTQVVAARGLAVPDATGGAVIDIEARTALNLLLSRLRPTGHGLISN